MLGISCWVVHDSMKGRCHMIDLGIHTCLLNISNKLLLCPLLQSKSMKITWEWKKKEKEKIVKEKSEEERSGKREEKIREKKRDS